MTRTKKKTKLALHNEFRGETPLVILRPVPEHLKQTHEITERTVVLAKDFSTGDTIRVTFLGFTKDRFGTTVIGPENWNIFEIEVIHPYDEEEKT